MRIFFLTHAESPQRLKQIIDEIRSATHVMRMLPYTMSQAVILRGTAAQIALANRIITEQDR